MTKNKLIKDIIKLNPYDFNQKHLNQFDLKKLKSIKKFQSEWIEYLDNKGIRYKK